MAFKDLLLQLTSYPERTPEHVIERAMAVAVLFEARITAAVCKVDLPDATNYIARTLTDIAAAIAAEREKGKTLSGALVNEFMAAAWQAGRTADTVVLNSTARVGSGGFIEHARVHDLTIMPVSDDVSLQLVAQDLIFGSGRPVLLLPETQRGGFKPDIVVVAWDGSRAAARAAADAMPFLALAKTVRLVTVTGDKPLTSDDSIYALRRNLDAHGIEPHVDAEPAVGFESAGAAITRFCARVDADLLVMGAYGHTRFRDFVMGGATKTLLATTTLPVLLSH